MSNWIPTADTISNQLSGAYGAFTSSTTALSAHVALFNYEWSTSTTTYSTADEEPTVSGGYTQGGQAVTLNVAGQDTDSLTLTLNANAVWDNTSGSDLTASYAVIYAGPSNAILAYFLLNGAPSEAETVSVPDGESLTISNSNPVLTVSF